MSAAAVTASTDLLDGPAAAPVVTPVLMPGLGPDEAPATASVADLYRALWRHGRARRGAMLLACTLLLSSELLKLLIPWLAGCGIDVLQRHGAAGMQEAGGWLAAMFATLLLSWAIYGPGRIIERNFALEVRTRHTDALTDRLLHAPLAWHEQRQTGELADRLDKATGALFYFAQEQYVYLKCAVMLIGPLVALWLISPWVGALAVAGHALIMALSMRMDRRLIRLAHEENQAERELGGTMYDVLSNVFTVFALRRRSGMHRLVITRLMQVFKPLRQAIVWNEAKWALVDILANLLWCALIAVYVWQAAGVAGAAGASGLALGGIFMVYQYAKHVDGVIGEIASQFSAVARQRADFVCQSPFDQAPQEAPDVVQTEASGWAELRLHGWDFTHAGRHDAPPALNGVDLVLRRGVRYGLVGPSGGGKTSLLRLLAGLDRPSAGTLTADGQAWQVQRLRAEATLIPQRAEMIFGSLRENLELGQPFTAPQLWQALQRVAAGEFVAPLHLALDTPVAEAGSNWSGGQMQRLALARGVLAASHSALVLLDEPTSSLDAETEQRVFAGLLQAFDGACVVAALHRLPLLHLVDEVIVFDQGRVIDVGPPQVVRARCALLQGLYEAQVAGRSGGDDAPRAPGAGDCHAA